MLRLLYALTVTGLVVALILITDNAPTASLAQNGPVSSPVGSPEPTEEPTEEPTKEPTKEPADDAGTGATTAVTLPSTGVGATPSVFSVPLLTLLASVVGLLAVAAHLVRGRT